jgi:hypothetical protein
MSAVCPLTLVINLFLFASVIWTCIITTYWHWSMKLHAIYLIWLLWERCIVVSNNFKLLWPCDYKLYVCVYKVEYSHKRIFAELQKWCPLWHTIWCVFPPQWLIHMYDTVQSVCMVVASWERVTWQAVFFFLPLFIHCSVVVGSWK